LALFAVEVGTPAHTRALRAVPTPINTRFPSAFKRPPRKQKVDLHVSKKGRSNEERAFEGETVSSVGNEVYARTDAAGNNGFGVGEKSPRSMALIAQPSPHPLAHADRARP
jgi:hypothetical protein